LWLYLNRNTQETGGLQYTRFGWGMITKISGRAEDVLTVHVKERAAETVSHDVVCEIEYPRAQREALKPEEEYEGVGKKSNIWEGDL